MMIKVIQDKSTGKYVKDIWIEYPPYTGMWTLTDDLSEAMVFRTLHQMMWGLEWMPHNYHFVYKEFTNFKYD